ncbi:MAG: hypothetical protein LBH18_08035 [Spirochaetaceae bacterium]|nr:hypothetical protein [Spirochaetaceae bacterium]
MKDAAFANTTNRLAKKTPRQTSTQGLDFASKQARNACNMIINTPPPPTLLIISFYGLYTHVLHPP